MYATDKKQQILDAVNDEQKLPVINYKGASIVLAGAGAGKTRTIIARAGYMIEDGVDPRSILIFTFTKKAANELRERIMQEIGAVGSLITTGTYHSFCCRILRQNIEQLGIWKSNFSIFDAEDSLRILKGIDQEYKEKHEFKVEYIQGQISDWKEEMISADVARQTCGNNTYLRICADYYKKYSNELIRQNALDFDDLIYVAIRLLEKFPAIKAAMNSHFKYVIADEAQDSSPRDLELIEHLMGDNKNICLVGDDFQSIYGFRGSDIEAFFDFVEKYDLKKFYLSQNYRSTQTIVNAAQSVIDKNPRQFKKNLFSENGCGMPITMYSVKSQKGEAQRVTKIVKALIKTKTIDSYKDIAVLYRMNYQSRMIEESFLYNNIPYHMLSGLPFYSRMEIKDIMAYMRLLVNPQDKVAFERAIQVPHRGIGIKTIESLNSCISAVPNGIMSVDQLITVLRSCAKGRAAKGIKQFTAILETLNKEKDTSPPRILINTLLDVTKYLPYLEEKEEREDYESRVKNIQELLSMADNYNSLNEMVGDFSVTENKTEVSQEENKDGVNMITIHGSKGLEFKVVILIGCNENTIPMYKAIQMGEVEEERRLFYVGLTRAKEKIFLIRSNSSVFQGVPRVHIESRFIDEIDDEYLERRTVE